MNTIYQFASENPWATCVLATLGLLGLKMVLKFVIILNLGYPPKDAPPVEEIYKDAEDTK